MSLPETALSSDPVQLAEKYRKDFVFTEEKQKKLKNPYEMINFLRDLIEDMNILVFQMLMPIEDARGFTLVDDSPAIIVINSGDSIEARIFTLMHEFGHVLLRESGISMPESLLPAKNVEKVEKWCNDFASAFLLPEPIAISIFSSNRAVLEETETLNKFSHSYKLSKAMILYKMAKLHFVSQSQYEAVLGRFEPGKSEKKGNRGRGFGTRVDNKCLSEKGQKFVSLVLSNVEKGFITHSDALGYLSIKSKNLEKVSKKAKK